MSLHSDMLSWFQANKSLLFLFNSAWLANTNFIVFGLTRSGLELTIYRTRGEHANHCTTEMYSSQKEPHLNLWVVYTICKIML